ncbi:hypothetical protein SNEBB_010180 [Seison nebaliae]|nr:hypothetical protein SNEBB_010180 [Seison nebaliae]
MVNRELRIFSPFGNYFSIECDENSLVKEILKKISSEIEKNTSWKFFAIRFVEQQKNNHITNHQQQQPQQYRQNDNRRIIHWFHPLLPISYYSETLQIFSEKKFIISHTNDQNETKPTEQQLVTIQSNQQQRQQQQQQPIRSTIPIISNNMVPDKEYLCNNYSRLEIRIRYHFENVDAFITHYPQTANFLYQQVYQDYINLYAIRTSIDMALFLGAILLKKHCRSVSLHVFDKKSNWPFLCQYFPLSVLTSYKPSKMKKYFKRLFTETPTNEKIPSLRIESPRNNRNENLKNLTTVTSMTNTNKTNNNKNNNNTNNIFNENQLMSMFLKHVKKVWLYETACITCYFNFDLVQVNVTVNYAEGLTVKKSSNEILLNVLLSRIVSLECIDEETGNLYSLKVICSVLPSKLLTNQTNIITTNTTITTTTNNNNSNSNNHYSNEENGLSNFYLLFTSKCQRLNFISLIDGYLLFLNNTEESIWKKLKEKFHQNSTLPQNEKKKEFRFQRTKSIEDEDIPEIDGEDVILKKHLNDGFFGTVYEAVYKTAAGHHLPVAIKTPKVNDDNNDKDFYIQELMNEAKMMNRLSNENIVQLIGISKSNKFYLIMELASNGPLNRYLQECSKNHNRLTKEKLLNYCEAIGDAIEYIHERKIIHRDIACRNVLMIDEERVKLSDFGLARQLSTQTNSVFPNNLGDYDMYEQHTRQKIPIKWMAPESINFRQFFKSSDIWMFGVCMWEIFSYGVKPWSNRSNREISSILEVGERLLQPDDVPDTLYNLMNNCWFYDTKKRPSIAIINECLYKIKLIVQSSIINPLFNDHDNQLLTIVSSDLLTSTITSTITTSINNQQTTTTTTTTPTTTAIVTPSAIVSNNKMNSIENNHNNSNKMDNNRNKEKMRNLVKKILSNDNSELFQKKSMNNDEMELKKKIQLNKLNDQKRSESSDSFQIRRFLPPSSNKETSFRPTHPTTTFSNHIRKSPSTHTLFSLFALNSVNTSNLDDAIVDEEMRRIDILKELETILDHECFQVITSLDDNKQMNDITNATSSVSLMEKQIIEYNTRLQQIGKNLIKSIYRMEKERTIDNDDKQSMDYAKKIRMQLKSLINCSKRIMEIMESLQDINQKDLLQYSYHNQQFTSDENQQRHFHDEKKFIRQQQFDVMYNILEENATNLLDECRKNESISLTSLTLGKNVKLLYETIARYSTSLIK